VKVFRSLVFLSLVSTASGLAAVRLESGDTQVPLLELYTSEGCSSCPPAETWFGQHYGRSTEWRSAVPVAFHVDYWDQLGWKDRFAKPEFTARQQLYSANWSHGSVYTPCFVLNGEEWSGWFHGVMPSDSRVNVGNLEATITSNTVVVRFSPATKPKEYLVFVAPLAMQVRSDVQAGENRGRRLDHDFVALSLASAKLEPRDSAYGTTLQVSMSGARAIALWITLDHSLVPIQATGGFLEQPIAANEQ
jgi:hypothetical protein